MGAQAGLNLPSLQTPKTCFLVTRLIYELTFFQVRDDDQFGTVLGTFCGNTLPEPVTSSSNRMWVKYRTDYSVSGTGFHAAYSACKLRHCWSIGHVYIYGQCSEYKGIHAPFSFCIPFFFSILPVLDTFWNAKTPDFLALLSRRLISELIV